MRRPLAAAAALFVAWLGALIAGEYELIGVTGVIAGALFGVAVAETVVLVARRPDLVLRVVAAAAAAGGVAYAVWRFSGLPGHRDWHHVHGGGWLGVAIAPLAAIAWLRGPIRGTESREADSRPRP